MSNAGIARVAVGTAELANANDEAQLNRTLSVIDLGLLSLNLYSAFDELLEKDTNTIFVDALTPDKPGQVSADLTQKEIDTNKSDQANSTINTVIEGSKQHLEVLGNNLIQVFSIIEPVKQVLAFFTGVLARKF
jgi:hypothetical protein